QGCERGGACPMFRMTLFCFFSSRRRHTRFSRDWSSDVCSSDLTLFLDRGNKVRVQLQFRGREMAHQEFGMQLMAKVKNDLAGMRSEERRVGKECSSRWSAYS